MKLKVGWLRLIPALAMAAAFGTAGCKKAAAPAPKDDAVAQASKGAVASRGPMLRVVFTGDNGGEIEPCG